MKMASKLANISEIVCSLSALLTGGVIMHRCCAHTCHSYAIQVTYYTPLMVIVIGWSGLFAAVAVNQSTKDMLLRRQRHTIMAYSRQAVIKLISRLTHLLSISLQYLIFLQFHGVPIRPSTAQRRVQKRIAKAPTNAYRRRWWESAQSATAKTLSHFRWYDQK